MKQLSPRLSVNQMLNIFSLINFQKMIKIRHIIIVFISAYLLKILYSKIMGNKQCVFCSIIKNNENILFQDEDLIVINDIKPASKYHLLVIPRKHIRDAKSLTNHDKQLLLNMIERAKISLQEKEDVDMSDIRLVFHWPPFTSISHLHLHAIAPASGMSFSNKMAFSTNTAWAVTPEYVMQRISS